MDRMSKLGNTLLKEIIIKEKIDMDKNPILDIDKYLKDGYTKKEINDTLSLLLIWFKDMEILKDTFVEAHITIDQQTYMDKNNIVFNSGDCKKRNSGIYFEKVDIKYGEK